MSKNGLEPSKTRVEGNVNGLLYVLLPLLSARARFLQVEGSPCCPDVQRQMSDAALRKAAQTEGSSSKFYGRDGNGRPGRR